MYIMRAQEICVGSQCERVGNDSDSVAHAPVRARERRVGAKRNRDVCPRIQAAQREYCVAPWTRADVAHHQIDQIGYASIRNRNVINNHVIALVLEDDIVGKWPAIHSVKLRALH